MSFRSQIYARYVVANTLRAYHGTPYIFDHFDLQHSGKQNDPGDYGRGIYFDTDKNWASAYAKGKDRQLLECVLHLHSPYFLDFDKYAKDKRQIAYDGYKTSKAAIEDLVKYKKMLKKGGLDVDDEIDNFLSISRRYGANKITEAIKRAGHDGVVVNYGASQEIVVFDPKQIEIINRHPFD